MNTPVSPSYPTYTPPASQTPTPVAPIKKKNATGKYIVAGVGLLVIVVAAVIVMTMIGNKQELRQQAFVEETPPPVQPYVAQQKAALATPAPTGTISGTACIDKVKNGPATLVFFDLNSNSPIKAQQGPSFSVSLPPSTYVVSVSDQTLATKMAYTNADHSLKKVVLTAGDTVANISVCDTQMNIFAQPK